MRISHFFIDRPIFASVLSIVFIILGGVAFLRLPVAQYPEIQPPIINVSGQYPGASAEVIAIDRGRADRGADQRRREHALHVVELERRRPLHDPGDVRYRHQSRYRAGPGAEPRRHRAAAPAAGRAPDRRQRRQELARPDDGRAHLFARPVARCALRFQLRQPGDQGHADPRRRRRLDHRVRRARLCDADLARSEPAAIAEPDRDRRHGGAAGAEHPGRVRRAQPAAGRDAGLVPGRGADARPSRRSRRVRQHRRQDHAAGGGAPQGRGARRARRAGLLVELLSQPRSGGGDGGVPAAGLERARHRQVDPRHHGDAGQALPARHHLRHRLRSDAVHRAVGRRGHRDDLRGDPARRAGGDPVPADLARRHHSDGRDPDLADRHVLLHDAVRLHAQQPVAVRPGAGGRHRGRRRDRRGRERRAQHRRGP